MLTLQSLHSALPLARPQMFNLIATYAPVPAVHLISLTDGGFWDTMVARGEFESAFVPVGGLSPAAPATVSC